jgi:D-glycero-D-manno-heptose 1,7-bisphosphate phosphatase
MEVGAVFLDRDGTIIEDVHYLSKLEEVKLLPFVEEGLNMLKQCGYKLIVVSNQSGVGRGYFSEDFVNRTHRYLNDMLGGIIDEFYFCPHTPNDNCNCRKPNTGMIDAAIDRFNINKRLSFVVGDKESDIELGLNAGVTPLLVTTGYGEEIKKKTKAAKVFNNLYEVAKWICREDFTG